MPLIHAWRHLSVVTLTDHTSVSVLKDMSRRMVFVWTWTSASKLTLYQLVPYHSRTNENKCQYLCVNTVGSYTCECPQGFVKEHNSCVDRDEVCYALLE